MKSHKLFSLKRKRLNFDIYTVLDKRRLFKNGVDVDNNVKNFPILWISLIYFFIHLNGALPYLEKLALMEL